MPFIPPPTPSAPDLSGPLGFFGASPTTRPVTYVNNYTPWNRTEAAYTANSQSTAYTGGLLDLLQAARLSDLNQLRVAVENLRVFSESAVQQHNALVNDLKTLGLIG